MLDKYTQKNISVSGVQSKFVGGNDNSTTHHHNYLGEGKLSKLFSKQKETFGNEEAVVQISNDLKRYTDSRDTIGLEDKLKNANKEHLYEDYVWLKQEFYKKLVLYQDYEPAQEIFSIILAIVLERYRNVIRPKIQNGDSEAEILRSISSDIIGPIISLLNEEGCDDIIGLSSTEIEGMFHYLTGNCHIKWTI